MDVAWSALTCIRIWTCQLCSDLSKWTVMNFDQRYSHVYICLLISYWNEKINTLLAILPGLLLHFVLVSSSTVRHNTHHRGSLPCRRHLLVPLTGNKEGSKSLTVLQVKPTPTRFLPNSLYTPMDNTPLRSVSSVCHPWGKCAASNTRYSQPVIHASANPAHRSLTSGIGRESVFIALAPQHA